MLNIKRRLNNKVRTAKLIKSVYDYAKCLANIQMELGECYAKHDEEGCERLMKQYRYYKGLIDYCTYCIDKIN